MASPGFFYAFPDVVPIKPPRTNRPHPGNANSLKWVEKKTDLLYKML